MKIKVEKMSLDEAQKKGITNWPIWEKEVSEFDWSYDSTEKCYILEGETTVKTDEGDVLIQAGDFVEFPKGLSCVWQITSPIRKHYNFE